MRKTANHPPARPGGTLPAGYAELLADVKARIAAARVRAVLAVKTARRSDVIGIMLFSLY
ncbi:MAG: hypothetical protein ACLQQB_10450 [Solirubrobacteraceae bacterium]